MKILLLAAVFTILFYAFHRAYKNTKDVIVNRVQAKQKTLQDECVFNILQLSDLHLENISISPEELKHKLQNESIDLIALTGDFLDRKRTIPKLAPYLQKLNELAPKYGIYAVFGNHDYVLKDTDLDTLKNMLAEYGVRLLQNENECILVDGKIVNVIGIDDYGTGRSDLAASYSGLQSGTNLVITHDPNVVLDMEKHHFDYLMAGHFHGGQICYPKAYHLVKMGKLVRLNMIKGMHVHHGKNFYINEGLGQTGVNIRIGSRPEITLHQLALAEEKEIKTAV
ncbi:metallophosphoesterase [Peribacillus sp. SCS-155]|uniref:metallophosphoesterase n=1 Tax=Peribacillus sedimenti TaxID=3115297 RepID=UPI003905FFC9